MLDFGETKPEPVAPPTKLPELKPEEIEARDAKKKKRQAKWEEKQKAKQEKIEAKKKQHESKERVPFEDLPAKVQKLMLKRKKKRELLKLSKKLKVDFSQSDE